MISTRRVVLLLSIVVPPADEYWQGDLFVDVPWGWLHQPQFVEPLNDGQTLRFREPPVPGGRGRLVINGGRDLGVLLPPLPIL